MVPKIWAKILLLGNQRYVFYYAHGIQYYISNSFFKLH